MARPIGTTKDPDSLRRQVQKMATIGMSRAEISYVLGISERSLARRKLDVAMRTGRAYLQRSLRLAQIKKAHAGDTGMLIWLGKQLLEQREPPHGLEISGSIEHEIASPDELKTGVLGRLARLSATGGAREVDQQPLGEADPSALHELRLLGAGQPEGAEEELA